jgi:SMC interacting uncharacterized protein involved in chromosome segregation
VKELYSEGSAKQSDNVELSSSIKIDSQIQAIEPHTKSLEKLHSKLINLATDIQGQSKGLQGQIDQLKKVQQTKTNWQPKKVNAVTLRYENSPIRHIVLTVQEDPHSPGKEIQVFLM